MAETYLKVQVRESTGKQAAKRLRREGMIPAVLYGGGDKPVSLAIEFKELLTLLHSSGRNTVVNLTIGKGRKKYKTFIYDIQHDPLSGDIIHVDLKQISLDEKIHVTVPIHLHGMPYGVKNEGGIIEHQMHAIEIYCLPTDIPDDIKIDVTDMRLGDVIHVRDLAHENFEMLTDMDSVVIHIIAPKVISVVEEEEEGELEGLEEGVEPELIGAEEEHSKEE